MTVRRVMITGSRHWVDGSLIRRALVQLKVRGARVFIHGAARGADIIGAKAAWMLGYHVLPFRADWNMYGHSAGSRRNQQMINEGRPDFVIAFPLPGSVGTWDAVTRAVAARITTRVWVGDRFVDAAAHSMSDLKSMVANAFPAQTYELPGGRSRMRNA